MNDTERLDVLERLIVAQHIEGGVEPELHHQLGLCLSPWGKGFQLTTNLSYTPCKTVREAIDRFAKNRVGKD